MKTNRVEVIQNYLEADGITAAETAIIDAALEVIWHYSGAMDLFKLTLMKKIREGKNRGTKLNGTN